MSDLTKDLDDAIMGQEIKINCPNCRKSFTIELRQTNGKVKCPYCKTVFSFKGKS